MPKEEKRLLSVLLGSSSAKIDADYQWEKACAPYQKDKNGDYEKRKKHMEDLVPCYKVSVKKNKAMSEFILSNPLCVTVTDGYFPISTNNGERPFVKRILTSKVELGKFFPSESDLKCIDDKIKAKDVSLLLISESALKQMDGKSNCCTII